MSLLSFFTRKSSAPVARDRLQILLAHERGAGLAGQSDLVAKLQEEILAVIAKHIAVDRDKVLIKLDRGSSVSTLEIDIEVPDLVKAAKESAAKDAAKAEIEADAKPVGPDTESGDGNNKKSDSQNETMDETKSDTKPDVKPALRAG